MLYIRDLRILQSTIDQTLVEVQVSHNRALNHCLTAAAACHCYLCLLQNYTANPKTDAALGRIGR